MTACLETVEWVHVRVVFLSASNGFMLLNSLQPSDGVLGYPNTSQLSFQVNDQNS